VTRRGRSGVATRAWAPAIDELIDGLGDRDASVRAASARACGQGRLEGAIPFLSERLLDPNRGVRASAAGALGRIGGARSADALLHALRTCRLGPGRLARELARSAPDFFLEAALMRPENRQIRAALALSAGLRGRSPRVAEQLLALLEGDPTERAAACHALGCLHYLPAVPFLMDALFDPSPRVRHAAAVALTRLGAREPTRRAKGDDVVQRPPTRSHLLDHLRIWRRKR
jgi:HEAT repeat protein